MTAPLPMLERRRTLLLAGTAAWSALGVILYVWAPLTAPAVLLLALVAPAAWCLLANRRVPLHVPSPVTLALALAAAYLALNTFWSLSPSSARAAVAALLLFVVAVHFTLDAMDDADAEALAAMSTGVYVGIVVAGALVCFEAFSHQWGRRTLLTLVPSLRSHPRDMVVVDGWVIFIHAFFLNRSVAALTFLFWPTVLAIILGVPDPQRRRRLLLGLAPIVAAILGSGHATSKIAFVGAAAAFAAFSLRPTVTRRIIVGVWVAMVLLAVPMAAAAYKSELYLATWMPRTAKHRIVIWGYTAELYAKAPILGAGVHTARALHDPNNPQTPRAPGSEFGRDTGLHSHNVYLQTWFEAGAVGALFLLGVGLLVLRSLSAAPTQIQPYLHATFATCALAGASSFSLWQPWFMASLGLAAVFAALGWSRAERGSQPRRSRHPRGACPGPRAGGGDP